MFSTLYPTHADGSRMCKAIIRVCVSVILSVILSVCPHDKTKTAETKIAKLGTKIVHHDISPPMKRSKGQRSKSQGHKVQKIEVDRTKTDETTITKLVTGIVCRKSSLPI